MRRVACSLVLALAAWSRALPQSVSPSIAQYEGNARGTLVIENTSLFPLTGILDVKGFEIDSAGDLLLKPLDTARVHVALSTMSVRLAAKQKFTVFYEAKSDSFPAWFIITVGFSAGKPQPGLNMHLELPQTVYLVQHEKLAAPDIVVRQAEYDSTTRNMRVVIENVSDRLGRLLEARLSAEHGRTLYFDACPMMPRGRRVYDIAWAPGGPPPDKLSLRFPGFTVERAVSVRPVVAANHQGGCSVVATIGACSCAAGYRGAAATSR